MSIGEGRTMDLILNATDWQLIIFFTPIIMSITEVFKALGLDKKFFPLSNIFFGIFAAYFFVPSGRGDIPSAILIGIITGLSASGLYSTGKNTIEQVKNGKN
jgi:predicted histidine transporter YuiF (NhaC family)